MTTMIVDELARIPMSPYLTATLTRAADYATAQAHREVTLEHLLLALAEDPEATVVLKASHVDLTRLTAEVSDFLGGSEDRLEHGNGQPIAVSADLRRILEAAAAAARQGRRREINGAIVLAAIVGDGRSAAAHLLRLQGLTFEEAIRALQSVPVQPAPSQAPSPAQEPQHHPQVPPPQQEQPRQLPQEREQQRLPPPSPPHPAPSAPPPALDPSLPASTEEILASARERLQTRTHGEPPAPASPPAPMPLPRANYPELGAPPRPAPASPPSHDLEREHPSSVGHSGHRSAETADDFASFGAERPGASDGRHGEPGAQWERSPPLPSPAPQAPFEPRMEPPAPPPVALPAGTARRQSEADGPRTAPPVPPDRRRAASGPFVGSWPLIEAGQLVENIPRRMRVDVPVVVEARIARADVKALAEGLQGGGAAFRHEIVVTKAMSVRLRAPDGGFQIENRSPETQWIENVLGLAADDYASWRWTVTARTRGRRQLQLIVSARTVGGDGVTAETALPDQVVEVKVGVNYAATARRWLGWIAAAVIGGLLARFGEAGFVIAKLLAAKHLGL